MPRAMALDFDSLEHSIGGGDDLPSSPRRPNLERFAAAFAALSFPGKTEFRQTQDVSSTEMRELLLLPLQDLVDLY